MPGALRPFRERETSPCWGRQRDRSRGWIGASLLDSLTRRTSGDNSARCQKARDESAYFSHDGVTRRLEKDDARPFYTAAEISQRRAAAKRDLAQFCPPT